VEIPDQHEEFDLNARLKIKVEDTQEAVVESASYKVEAAEKPLF